MQQAFAVDMRNIIKQFSGVTAVDNVSFQVMQGEIHALVGENGAGKSTLMKVLSGIYPHYSYKGKISIFGNEVHFRTPKDANRASIAMIQQELALVHDLTVAENLFLGRLPSKAGIVDWRELRIRAKTILETLNLDVDLNTKIRNLGIGQQQLIEIAKAILLDCKIMILDEPTAPLTDNEINYLFDVLQDLQKRGITLLYISHRMHEIEMLTDCVTVMRDGRLVDTLKTSQTNNNQIVSMMIGRELKDLYPRRADNPGEKLLSIENYSVPDPYHPGELLVKEASMYARSGEIVGMFGLLGAGRSELMSAVTGNFVKKGTGRVEIAGKPVKLTHPSQAIRQGVAFVTEDRKSTGLIVDQSISNNISITNLPKLAVCGILKKKKENAQVGKMIEKLRIKTNNVKNIVTSLSGGNQQKVVLAKWLNINPRILILDEPTRGVDVGARSEIYNIMKELAAAGVAIVMISSDLPELIGMSNRVYVMYEGKINGELPRNELTEESVMSLATNIME